MGSQNFSMGIAPDAQAPVLGLKAKKSKLPVFPAGADDGFLPLFRVYLERCRALEHMSEKRLKTCTDSTMWTVWYWAAEALETQVKNDRETLERVGILQPVVGVLS